MSILYCSLVLTKENIKVAQSSKGSFYDMQIRNNMTQIKEGSVNDRINFDDKIITYTRSKEIIFIAISLAKYGENLGRRFIEHLINRIVDLGNIKEMLSQVKLKELCLQTKLEPVIDECMSKFNSDDNMRIREIQSDVDEIKLDLKKGLTNLRTNIEDLDELDKQAKKIKLLGKEVRDDAKKAKENSRCCKPWMVITIIIASVILGLVLIYGVISLIRCGDLNIACRD